MARARNSKGRFVKGSSKALVRTHSKTVTHQRRASHSSPARKAPRRGRRGKHSGGVTLAKLAVAGAALGFLFTERTPIQQLRTTAEKIPGAKTFGAPAMVGAIAYGLDHFGLIRSPWLRAAGYVAVGLAAVKLGEQNKDFKFLGDAGDDDFVGDID